MCRYSIRADRVFACLARNKPAYFINIERGYVEFMGGSAPLPAKVKQVRSANISTRVRVFHE